MHRVTLRVPPDLDRRIAQEARRARKTKSALLRDAIQPAFGDAPPPDDPAREARRQSLPSAAGPPSGRPSTSSSTPPTRGAGGEARRHRRRGGARGVHRQTAAGVVVQSDLFNPTHASVTVCPITSDCVDAPLFRITLPPGARTGLKGVSQVMIDKIVSVPRRRSPRKSANAMPRSWRPSTTARALARNPVSGASRALRAYTCGRTTSTVRRAPSRARVASSFE